MCEPTIATAMAIGAATGAAGSAITGGDPLQGAVFGAVTGGMLPDPGFSSTGFLSNLGSSFGANTMVSATFGMSAA